MALTRAPERNIKVPPRCTPTHRLAFLQSHCVVAVGVLHSTALHLASLPFARGPTEKAIGRPEQQQPAQVRLRRHPGHLTVIVCHQRGRSTVPSGGGRHSLLLDHAGPACAGRHHGGCHRAAALQCSAGRAAAYEEVAVRVRILDPPLDGNCGIARCVRVIPSSQ